MRKNAVQMARGAPKGNRNRLVHGRYSRAGMEYRRLRRARLRAFLAECEHRFGQPTPEPDSI